MFDKKIEKAIEILWIKEERNMGSKAIELLEEAANEGNGDAYFFLARCCFGECYIDPIFGFPEEDEKGYAYLEKSMEMGSAVGMMGAMRVGGFSTARGTYVYPPYNSTKQIWEEVAQKAKEGQVFCKYMIANSYYYGDVIELLHIPRGEITDSKIREFQYEAARLYEECIKSGLGFGVHNLEDIYTSGDYGIPKNPKKMLEIKKLGAEHNIREYVRMMGEEYLDKDVDKAEEYFLRAAEKYDYDSYYYLTKLYTYGGKRPLDLRKAKDYAEAGLAIYEYSQGCNNLLGEICFYGGDGVPQDYSKAVKCFEKVLEENNWGAAMLGTCYLKGLGTEKNVEKARNLFLGRENDKLSILGLGEIYCFGLGVEQDIKKGMGYLNQLPSHPRTREIKSHFKRGLFGWKERT